MIDLSPYNADWGFVCGRISTLEARLLSVDFFQTLVGHPKVEDVLRQLQDTPLRDFVVPGADWQDWSGVIDQYFNDVVRSIRHDCPDPSVANLFILRNDYLNLKLAVTGQNDFPFPAAMIETDRLLAVAAGDVSVLSSPYREAAAEARAAAEDAGGESVDVVLDGAYMRHLLALGEATGAALVRRYVEEKALALSLVAIWRRLQAGVSAKLLQEHMLPMGPATSTLLAVLGAGDPANWTEYVRGHLGELLREALENGGGEAAQKFEDLAFNYLVAMSRRGQGQIAGPERVLAFLRTLASEAHNLKLIVCGRLSRIDAAALRQRMRAVYV